MTTLVNATVGVECVAIRWERGIEVCLAYVGLESINVSQRSPGIDG